MTQGLDIFAPTCSCRGRGASDLLPLLITVAALVLVHFVTKGTKKWKGAVQMKNIKNLAVVVVLIAAVLGIIVIKRGGGTAAAPALENSADAPLPSMPAERALPRLVDLGADKCIPCKMMAPILEELKQTYAGQLQVDFIDVWKNPGAGQQYGIRVIPTQIFFGPDGKELARHEGFMSREDILAQWARLGFSFESPEAR